MGSPQIDAIGIAVSDMAVSVAFYSRLGLDFPPDAEAAPHAEAMLGSGIRLMLDTEAMLRQIDPDWSATSGGRLGLAVRSRPCSARCPVRRTCRRRSGRQGTVGRVLGTALRRHPRSR